MAMPKWKRAVLDYGLILALFVTIVLVIRCGKVGV